MAYPSSDAWLQPDPLIGRVFGARWTILRKLGTGGTGSVYEAAHRNGRHCAIKVLHGYLAHQPSLRTRFLLEGSAANRVSHPGIVAVLDDGEEPDGTAFLVMELLEGQSLAERLKQSGPFTAGEVVTTMLPVLEALATAHDRGVFHRDLKPANIFRTLRGELKLLDFGVARVTETSPQTLTQPGATVGTPAFMAPEQAAGRMADVDALADIWSAGATMFQLLTGRVVHESSSSNGVLVAAATTPAPLIRSVAPHVPTKIAKIVDRALAFERERRWPNARAMRRALTECSAQTAVVRDEPDSGTTHTELEAPVAIRAGTRRPGKSVIVIAATAFFSTILVGLCLPRPSKPQQTTSRTSSLPDERRASEPRQPTRAAALEPVVEATTAHAVEPPPKVIPVASASSARPPKPRQPPRVSDKTQDDEGLLDRRK